MRDHQMKELLVVDDEPRLCRALKGFFEGKGFHVATATTIQDALEQLRHLPAEVVLLDLSLPDGSGLDILAQLKAQYPNVRVVVISGVGDSQTADQAMQRGASNYLSKPFDFAECFYAAMGIETVNLSLVHVTPQVMARVPASVALEYQVLPVAIRHDILTLAMADPFDVQRVDELKSMLGCEITPLAAIGGDLSEAIQRCYGVGAGMTGRLEDPSTMAPANVAEPATTHVRDESHGIARLVSDLIQHAQANRATDLHVGIGPQGAWIRERIDGILYDVPLAPQFARLYPNVISRIKVMANLDIAEHRLPQDGRLWFELGATKLDLRISVLPTPHGEGLAIRLLEPSRMLHLEQLGLTEDQGRQMESVLAKPMGLLVVTGPTGSGKSTSLYAFLSQLNTGRVNIVTIEDPIEHELPGVTQTQVQTKIGLTFSTGLRSMLRHDPDIIMVGEIRDQETASLAVRSSLTGHLVLSTLHTNDATSGITRLVDLGIEPFLLCSTLSGILSQRLIRLLCPRCRQSLEVDASALGSMGVTAPDQKGSVTVWKATGCQHCRDTGYHNRIGVFEFLPVDHHIRSLIIKRTSSAQIRQSAMSRGMSTLWQCGWQKMQAGLTSLEELLRVLPQDER